MSTITTAANLSTLRTLAGKASGEERDALIWAIETIGRAQRAAAYVESAITAMGRAAKNLPEV